MKFEAKTEPDVAADDAAGFWVPPRGSVTSSSSWMTPPQAPPAARPAQPVEPPTMDQRLESAPWRRAQKELRLG